MKAIVGYLCLAAVLVLAGVVFLGAGLLNRNTARGQQSANALKYGEADQSFATSERYLQYESHLPWVGDGPVNDIRTRRAAIRYWQRQYGALVSQQTDGGNGAAADNVGVQVVAANAAYRAGQAQAKDKTTMLQAVDAGLQANLAILKNTARQDDAAYNYEYLARLRESIQDGHENLKAFKAHNELNGVAGDAIMEGGDSTKFKTIVPETNDERQKDGGAGKVQPAQRKG